MDSVHPNSLANLRPIPADLRSDNTGKTYKFHPRREARRLLNRTGTELLERLEKIGLNSESEANAIRAIQELFNRGFGKPTETVRHSGSIQHNLTGKRLAELSIEELTAIQQNPTRYLKAHDGTIVEAEYTDNSVPENGDSDV